MRAILQGIRVVDINIYHFFSSFAGNWFLDRLAAVEESNRLLKGGVFFAIYWYLWFRPGTDRERRRRVILAALIGAILAIAAVRTIAFTVPFRIRPMDDPTLAHPSYAVAFHYDLVNWSGFPSDTAAYYFALAFGVMYLSRRLAIPIAIYTAVWICLTRIYLGIHYASDIVAGTAIGIAVAWIAVRSDWLQSIAARPVRAADSKPQWFYPAAFLLSYQMTTVFDGLRNLGNAMLHAVLAAFHRRGTPSHLHRPIDSWGGFIALAAFSAAAIYVVSIVSRIRRRAQARLRSGVTRFRSS